VIFERVICGVDATDESIEAARQAARLVDADGRLVLVAVAELEVAAQAGFAASMVAKELEEEASSALDRATEAVAGIHAAERRLLSGPVPATLQSAIEQERASLIVVGTHGHGRGSGILFARASTTLLHDAPCSVLVARRAHDPEAFPASIAVGLDGSPEADAAAAVADELAERFGAVVRRIVATGGKGVEADAIEAARPGIERSQRKALDALVGASEEADLVIVGNRGRHGLKALGSVSERLAHQARCSVLVVRVPADARS
jgi:nucleotide-binding universal stress UspA family protein